MNAPDPHQRLQAPESGADPPPGGAELGELLLGLFRLVPLGIELVDLGSGRTVECNPALTEITGHPREALLCGAAQATTADDATAPSQRIGRNESELTHRDGRRVPIEQCGARVVMPDGRRYRWNVVRDVSEHHAMDRALADAATHDRLTGLPNRNALARALGAHAARARQEPGFGFAVLFLDFDRFKLVNDTLGHDAGDELLRAIAERLRAVLPAGDAGAGWMAARFGGDEFVVLASALATEAQARPFAERLLATLAAPYGVKGREIHSSASVGIALGAAGHTDADVLLRDADTAMYEAKRQGRGRLAFFDDAMRERLTRAVRIEDALRHAVARHELRLVYQPIVDLDSGNPVGVEALVRWRHPALGLLGPAEFIRVAEDSGHIVEIGRWVLRMACRDWAVWRAAAGERAPRQVSVNLSHVELADPGLLVSVVREALDGAAMPPGALQLEMSERAVMKDPPVARQLIDRLHQLGVRAAMDEFGSGSSSLACLRQCPFDAVKIDKSFVTDLTRDPQVMAVAHATINVIENLGMASVAEGIEDSAELATLQAMGCRHGQGYLFGRPVPAQQLLDIYNGQG